MHSSSLLALYTVWQICKVERSIEFFPKLLCPLGQYSQNSRWLDSQIHRLNIFGWIWFKALGHFPSNWKVSILFDFGSILFLFLFDFGRIFHMATSDGLLLFDDWSRLHVSVCYKIENPWDWISWRLFFLFFFHGLEKISHEFLEVLKIRAFGWRRFAIDPWKYIVQHLHDKVVIVPIFPPLEHQVTAGKIVMSQQTHVVYLFNTRLQTLINLGWFRQWVFQLHISQKSVHFILHHLNIPSP